MIDVSPPVYHPLSIDSIKSATIFTRHKQDLADSTVVGHVSATSTY